ncbi:MAG TPA: hypothetical protein VFI34_11445 [Candidatus Limnocylindrales bacterium]|nr:hypothetical protein [Candidatus Limnocylindrales bacterium]
MSRRAGPAPRWQTPLPSTVVGSWGPEVAYWATRELGGIRLDRWQQRALNRALAVDKNDRLVHSIYLVSTGRQNGKTLLVRALIGWALTAGETPEWSRILGLAHDRGQARIPYEAVLADLQPIKRRNPRGGLALTRYLGIRSDLYGRHREYHTGSKESRNAIRGSSNDLAPFDEIRTQVNYETWNALLPTTLARPDPLILGTSTAGDDRSVLLRDWWERGRRIMDGAEAADGFGMTWYAADDDDDPEDPVAWRKSMPAFVEGRLTVAAIRTVIAGLTTTGRRQEILNLWSEGGDEWLPPGTWHATIGAQPGRGIRIVLGAEVASTWRRATITVAIVTDSGAWVGIADELDSATTPRSSIGPADLKRLLERTARRWPKADEIAFSGSAAAAPHVKAWAEAKRIRATALTGNQTKAASQLFRAELVGRRLTHGPDPLLAQQVRVARPSADLKTNDWYFSLRLSEGEIDALRAAAWAAWAAIAPEEREAPPQVFL